MPHNNGPKVNIGDPSRAVDAMLARKSRIRQRRARRRRWRKVKRYVSRFTNGVGSTTFLDVSFAVFLAWATTLLIMGLLIEAGVLEGR